MALDNPAPEGMFTAERDITETLPDGRTIQVATKGGQMPMSEARRLGLVKSSEKPQPAENKALAANGQPAEETKTTTAALTPQRPSATTKASGRSRGK